MCGRCGRSPRRYRLAGQWHEQPVAVRDEIAWLGPERQDRYERYGWNYPALAVVGTGLHRTDIPLERLRAAERAQVPGFAAPHRQRRPGAAALPHLVLWRAPAGAAGACTGLARSRAAARRSCHGAGCAEPATVVRCARRCRSADCTWICSPTAKRTCHRGRPPAVAGSGAGALCRRAHVATPEAGAGGDAGATAIAAKAAAGEVRRVGRPLFTLRQATVWVDEKRVLAGIDLVIRRGECWVIRGGNGAGKSTLLRTLYGDHAVAAAAAYGAQGWCPACRWMISVPARAWSRHTCRPIIRGTTRVLDTVVSVFIPAWD